MRFFEIASPKLRIEATRRFVKNASSYLKSYGGLEKIFREFLEFKTAHPSEQFGVKDIPMISNPLLKGYMHCHLMHGKVILMYKISNGVIWLYDMVEHSAFDNANQAAKLGHYMNSLDAQDFDPYGLPERGRKSVAVGDPWDLEVKLELPKEQMDELDALYYEMAIHDKDIIIKAINGSFHDIFEFMELTIPEKGTTIIQAYGGPEGFKKHLASIMQSVGG